MKTRVVKLGDTSHTKIVFTDWEFENGERHEYEVFSKEVNKISRFLQLYFQGGPIKENGVNGCQVDDLIVIAIDRLQHFQRGQYRCEENANALRALGEALYYLQLRKVDREARGVEGTHHV